MKDKQSGIRRAVIGLYSDGVKMSVSEQAENGQWFCLHRSEEEEDFFAQNCCVRKSFWWVTVCCGTIQIFGRNWKNS